MPKCKYMTYNKASFYSNTSQIHRNVYIFIFFINYQLCDKSHNSLHYVINHILIYQNFPNSYIYVNKNIFVCTSTFSLCISVKLRKIVNHVCTVLTSTHQNVRIYGKGWWVYISTNTYKVWDIFQQSRKGKVITHDTQ